MAAATPARKVALPQAHCGFWVEGTHSQAWAQNRSRRKFLASYCRRRLETAFKISWGGVETYSTARPGSGPLSRPQGGHSDSRRQHPLPGGDTGLVRGDKRGGDAQSPRQPVSKETLDCPQQQFVILWEEETTRKASRFSILMQMRRCALASACLPPPRNSGSNSKILSLIYRKKDLALLFSLSTREALAALPGTPLSAPFQSLPAS